MHKSDPLAQLCYVGGDRLKEMTYAAVRLRGRAGKFSIVRAGLKGNTEALISGKFSHAAIVPKIALPAA